MTARTLDSADGTASAVPSAEWSWVLLAAADDAGARSSEIVRPQRIVGQLVLAALVVVGLVGLGGALVSQRVAEQQSVHDVAELTDVLAQSALQPALTDAMLTDPAAARVVFDPLVRQAVLGSALVRVKLWTPEGTVLYSDEPQLIGRTYALDDEARSALTVPQTEASISDLSRPENQFERNQGRLLEVYRPVWTPGGHPLLFETYFRYDTVSERSRDLWRGFVGIILSSLAALLLLLTPIVWSLLRRARRAQDQRQTLMRRAVESSDAERRRIAGSLHDGVVQQLVASSLDISVRAQRAAAAGDQERAADLNGAATTLRSSVAGLRSLLVDIYPPNLASAGLSAALRDLAATMTASPATIVLDLDDDAIDQLSPAATEAVFRVVQEVLRNAIKHADAATINVRIADRADFVSVDIDDDGVGLSVADFSAQREESLRDGHLGLQLIVDSARAVGARLWVASDPGHGTHYRLEVPTP